MSDTKIGQVLEHLQSEGSITSWEAITRYHATRLSAIIYDLRKQGHNIATTMEESNGAIYARYTLEEGGTES